jgi:acetylornithine deacetylase/succinyl-diaminopimelate desuccinylase-like protein
MNASPSLLDRLRPHVRRERLVATALALIGVPSPTGNAKAVADRLAAILQDDGFRVERPTGGYDAAPAVAVRWESGRPGRTLQFNGHLDTVHLPFVAPAVVGDNLTGSGASDMKAGIAAAVEALRALRDANALAAGSVLLTAHDLHESPWGDGRQLDALIREGYVGDAVLLPEPLRDELPVVGRGLAVWKVAIRRPGPPVHEVMRPSGEPSVIRAAARLILEIEQLDSNLRALRPRVEEPNVDPGPASAFIGQVHAGEIYNQYAQICRLEGTRRWLPGSDSHQVEREFRTMLARLADETKTEIDCDWIFTRDAFFLDLDDPLVALFQRNHAEISGCVLPLGAKPFVDDGNSFWAIARVPAITHGPRAGGQHTVNEWVSIDDLERVALLYAATAVAYCDGSEG